MNVSTKSEYGMRAMIYLAERSEKRLVPAREIAQHWKVPVKYLEQILKILKDAGLVESQLGVNGGYRLSLAPALITAGEVIRALDGRLAPIGCVSHSEYVPCEFESGCGLKGLWQRTYAAILGVLDHTTIADLTTMESSPDQAVLNGEPESLVG
jgi:Rrf2 family transcriptional regulator, cysteine metabolism repressor